MSAPGASDTNPPGGAAVATSTTGGVGSSSSSSASSPTIDQLLESSDEARKLHPNAATVSKSSGYLQAKIDMQKPILAAMLSECPPVLHPFLPYDSSYTASIQVINKWWRAKQGTYTVSLLPSLSEIESADLLSLYRLVIAFVKDRLGVQDQKGSFFGEKVTSSSVVIACVVFTTLVRIFNGAQGADLLAKLSTYQSFVATMQTLLLDKHDADSKLGKSLKNARGKSNDPSATGQTAFACLATCSKQAEQKKREVRQRCFKESLPRADGIHATLSTLRRGLLLLFLRVHLNATIPVDFDYLLQGTSDVSIEKPSPIFMKDAVDMPMGLSVEAADLLTVIKRDGLFNELVNVATAQLAAALDEPNANEAVEVALGAKSVIDQTKAITYSAMLGERGLLKKLQLAEASMQEKDQTPLMYPMLMSELEHCPSLFLGCVVLRKMTHSLFMAQIQLANLTPIVASEAIEAYCLSLAEFATDLRNFITRLTAARDHIASMSRFGFALNYINISLLAHMMAGGGEGAASTSSSSSAASAPDSTGATSTTGGSCSRVSDPPPITPAGVLAFLHYYEVITSFKTSKHSLRYINDLGKIVEEIGQHVDVLFDQVKELRAATDVVRSYAMLEQAITDLRKFSNVVSNATGKQLTLHDKPLRDFRNLLAAQAEMVLDKRQQLRRANDISLALSQGDMGGFPPPVEYTQHPAALFHEPYHAQSPYGHPSAEGGPGSASAASSSMSAAYGNEPAPMPTSYSPSHASAYAREGAPQYGAGSGGPGAIHGAPGENRFSPQWQGGLDTNGEMVGGDVSSRRGSFQHPSSAGGSLAYSSPGAFDPLPALALPPQRSPGSAYPYAGEPSYSAAPAARIVRGPGPFAIEDPIHPIEVVRGAHGELEPSSSRPTFGGAGGGYYAEERDSHSREHSTAAGGLYDPRLDPEGGPGAYSLPPTQPPSPTRTSMQHHQQQQQYHPHHPPPHPHLHHGPHSAGLSGPHLSHSHSVSKLSTGPPGVRPPHPRASTSHRPGDAHDDLNRTAPASLARGPTMRPTK